MSIQSTTCDWEKPRNLKIKAELWCSPLFPPAPLLPLDFFWTSIGGFSRPTLIPSPLVLYIFLGHAELPNRKITRPLN